MKRSYLFSLILLVWSLPVISQVRFFANADKQVMLQSDFLVFTITAENCELKSFNLPPLKDFKVSGGPSVSSNWSMINGKVSKFKSWSFMLTPVRSGNLTIESISANIEGATYKTEEIKIKVTKTPQVISSNVSSGEDYFVVANCNKSSVYIGEPVFVSFKIYTSKNLFDVQFPKSATFKGFWKYDLPQDNQQLWKDEMHNGKRYKTVVLQEMILFPQAEGKLEITPLQISGKVEEQIPLRPRDIFEEFFGRYETKVYDFKMNSNLVKIDVKPVPEDSKPSSFNGLVGNFKVERSVNKDSCKVDEVVTLKYIINGRGNFDAINTPELQISQDVEIYDPEVKDQYGIKNSGLEGSKKFEFTIIPKQAGIIIIPKSSLSYFDLTEKKYVEIILPEQQIYAYGTSQLPSVNEKIEKQNDVATFYDVRKISNLQTKQTSFYSSSTRRWFLLSPVLLLVSAFAIKKIRDKNEMDEETGYAKSSKAMKEAKQRLKKAKTLMSNKLNKEFYSEVNSALMTYSSWKLGIQQSNLSKENVSNELLKRGIASDKVNELFSIIENCEMALYSSQAMEQNPQEFVYKKALEMIIHIENKLIRK